MRLEQAFYTRGTNLLNEKKEGLGIAAASNTSHSFLEGCMRIGSCFDRERSGENAQFLLYSGDFQCFVGVGLAPADNRDGGNVNKLCHLMIPSEEQRARESVWDPNQYILEYPYRTTYEKGEILPVLESVSCLEDSDYQRILSDYHLDRKKLAYFLYCLYPIFLGEKNQLLIVLDEAEHRREEFAVIARELTWLAACLVPGKGERGKNYQKRLGYAVYSRDNISRVNLVYTEEESLGQHRFYLDQMEEEVPECFEFLAGEALESSETYQKALTELLETEEDSLKSSTQLMELYFKRKIKLGEKITEKDFPDTLSRMAVFAQDDDEYRNMVMEYIRQTEMIESSELLNVWSFVKRWEIKEEETEKVNYREMIKRLIDFSYIGRKHYEKVIKTIPSEERKKILEELYQQENSCMWKHIGEADTMEAYVKAVDLYRDIQEEQTDQGKVLCEDQTEISRLRNNQAEMKEKIRVLEEQLSVKKMDFMKCAKLIIKKGDSGKKKRNLEEEIPNFQKYMMN